MKTSFFNIAALAFTAISGVTAGPAPNGMSVEISERDGVLEVREVPRSEAGIQCRECVHLGGRCTIGDGSCYASEHASQEHSLTLLYDDGVSSGS
ncbi:NLS2 [Fusarium beomiforme]|uniref:NLS2 n=1 Tax=Fusarium beomiforme TaxID=44412 RepID=A0A9P5AE00_9HYPO|nr:NLS2 [Fusarium beomiforme]